MQREDPTSPKNLPATSQEEPTELVMFKRLAMQAMSVSKDEILHIDADFKIRTSKRKPAADPQGKRIEI